MAATRRIPLALLLLTTLTTAINLNVDGVPEPGETIVLSWDGEAPWSLTILTAPSAQDSFTADRFFTDMTVTNAVWRVDVAFGTLVQFEITDATGDTASQFIQIDDGGLALSSSSVASQSSESVASTQSVESVFSESSVAFYSSLSEASTSSLAALTTSTTELPASTPVDSNVGASPSQTVSDIPPATLSASSSTASQTSGIVVPPNQLNTSSGPKPGAIAGGVIAAILGLLFLLVLGRICYRRRLRIRERDQEAKIYPFMVDEALTNTASSNHRRTLSRGNPPVVNWNPEEPHLTTAGPVPSGQEYFGNRNYRLSSSLGKFGELGATENINALGMDLNPPPPVVAPTPTPPQPVMTTVPNATMPSVLDLARQATNKRASDMPLYNRASAYNPTTLQAPNFGRPSLDSQSGTGTTKVSPFADKFAVEGKYEPDLDDPEVLASIMSAQAPRPPRPARPEGLELDEASATDASASTSTPPPRPAVAPHRNSISNIGPVPTVGHSRKISNPIPIVMPKSPPVRARQQQRSVDLLPSWALVNHDGRYPAITVQTPTTATTVSSPTGSMAGVGAGRIASSQPGRQIYPAAALPPTRQPSLKGKRVSVAQSERGMSAAAIQAARAQSPPTVRSPPPGAMRAQSPPAVMQSPPAILARAQSPPAVLARAQSPPVLATLVQSPPPTVSHKPSTSVEAPPRPPRAVGPRAKPVRAPSETEIPGAPIVTLPLTPPRRIWAEPDVPTTPTTPALSAFPTPPRSMKNVTAGSSSSSMVGSAGHKLHGSGSSVASRSSTIITAADSAFSPVPTTAATSAYPDIELNGPTPVASPQAKGRALQPPPPIATGLSVASSSYAVSSAPNGLSPITASPQSVHHPQIPTPLASSTLGSPTTLAQFGQAMLPGGGGITRDSSVKTTYTMSPTSEGAHNALRRELMQGLPSAVGMAHNIAGPSSPTYFPESVSNYHPPVSQLPPLMTPSARVPRPAVESWGLAPSIFDASSMNGAGKHVSIAPSYVSANSGRRLSEGASSGDAEWKELERQLATNGSDVAHIMPGRNGSM